MKMPSPSSETVMPVQSSAKSRSRSGRSSFTCPIVAAAMLVAIDGPAGAGKSTVARAVARALGFTYLDSGAMYRAAALSGGAATAGLHIDLGDRVLLDGEDVTDAIRTPEVSAAASKMAARPEVRAALVAKQRELISNGNWV